MPVTPSVGTRNPVLRSLSSGNSNQGVYAIGTSKKRTVALRPVPTRRFWSISSSSIRTYQSSRGATQVE